jgi:hypothetical protein
MIHEIFREPPAEMGRLIRMPPALPASPEAETVVEADFTSTYPKSPVTLRSTALTS